MPNDANVAVGARAVGGWEVGSTVATVLRRALVLSIALLATSCASTATTAETAAPATTAPAPEASEATTAAPTTSTTTTTTTTTIEAPPIWNLVGGGQIEPGSIEGQDTVLWFWAPW
jgi:hypothetical protein